MAGKIDIELLREEDIPELIRFYNHLYKENRTIEKFRWEFFTAPAGGTIYVVAKDAENGKIVGSQCAIPIHLQRADGTKILTAKSEDTLVDPTYRGMSIFENMYKLLFAECEKAGIKYLWGFTSAKKPFERLGFALPYSHSQSLFVKRISGAYQYLSSLNAKNTAVSRMKIFGLCIGARFKAMFAPLSSAAKEVSAYECIIEHKNSLYTKAAPVENLLDSGFSIQQDRSFMDWRITTNPYHSEVLRVAFTSGNETLGDVIFNHHKNGTWYLIADLYNKKLNKDQRTAMFRHAIHMLHKNVQGAALVRTWDFTHNQQGRDEIQMRLDSGFVHLERGVYFVWKGLGDQSLNANDFALSRIASQGMI